MIELKPKRGWTSISPILVGRTLLQDVIDPQSGNVVVAARQIQEDGSDVCVVLTNEHIAAMCVWGVILVDLAP